MLEQRQALLRLLGDDDPATVDLVKTQLSQAGAESLPELQILLHEANPAAALQLRDVIAEIEERDAAAIFGDFCTNFDEQVTLEDAVWRLAAAFSPGDAFVEPRQLLDKWGAEVARRLRKASTALDRVETLSEYLSEEVRLRGNEEDYYNLDNSLLPQVIESGLGIPISLSIVYILVARRAGLWLEGVGLPGHFMVRHEEIFFDPFHGGCRVSLDECRALMRQQNLTLRPEHLLAATPRQILLRALTNIYYVAERNDPVLAAKVADWIGSLRS